MRASAPLERGRCQQVAARRHPKRIANTNNKISSNYVAESQAASPQGGNLPPPFTLSDAPPAACNRALRRIWVKVANRALIKTGDAAAAIRAAAHEIMAALDCDARIAKVAKSRSKRWGGHTPVTPSPEAQQRGTNRNGAGDRGVDAILAGKF